MWRTEPTLLLDLSREAVGGAPVQGTLRLSYDGPSSTAGQTVSLVREGGGMQATLPSVVTDGKGQASFTDAPPAGDTRYVATVAANGIHPQGSVSRSTSVLTATTLTARTAATSTAGTPVKVSGELTAQPDLSWAARSRSLVWAAARAGPRPRSPPPTAPGP